MKVKDARTLSPSAQEALRKRVVGAVQEGMSQTEAANVFKVARGTVNRWCQAFRKHGEQALVGKKRGRKKSILLKPWQAATIVRMITDRCPDQLKMPFVLWTRQAVAELVERKFGLHLSVWTVGRYLKRWGFTPQKPLSRAYEQDPKRVKAWVEEEYPKIQARAKSEGAEVFWGDEMGVRSDFHAGTTYGRKGRTPVIPATGKRFGVSMISAITNRGKLAFMVFEDKFTAPVFLRFLKRLIQHAERKVFLIVDNHPVHRSKKVQSWVSGHSNEIQLFFLPPYSPQVNPDELLNHDTKANAVGRKRVATKQELVGNLRAHLRSRQRSPEIIRAFFQEKNVRYAA
jgi:transposase